MKCLKDSNSLKHKVLESLFIFPSCSLCTLDCRFLEIHASTGPAVLVLVSGRTPLCQGQAAAAPLCFPDISLLAWPQTPHSGRWGEVAAPCHLGRLCQHAKKREQCSWNAPFQGYHDSHRCPVLALEFDCLHRGISSLQPLKQSNAYSFYSEEPFFRGNWGFCQANWGCTGHFGVLHCSPLYPNQGGCRQPFSSHLSDCLWHLLTLGCADH